MSSAAPSREVLERLRSKEEQLFLKWNVVMKPSELLRDITANRENARSLFHGVRRQVRAVRRRSQASRDGQVTIFDLVLVRLFETGHTMQDYGLLEFYLAEFLGTKDCVSTADANRIVAAHLAAQRILDDGPIDELPTVRTANMQDQEHESTQQSISTRYSEEAKPPYLDNLIRVYERAKDDNYKVGATHSHNERSNNVRFLRDTAENLLRYLEAFNQEHELIPELADIIKSSQARAEELAGGRKRKFEHERRSPSMSPWRNTGYTYEYDHRTGRGGYAKDGWDHSRVSENWNRAFDSYRPRYALHRH
ncbi:hypothetical protein N7508_010334 [Penicillium antarcticum]|uniref:uncharacterized protein n=1 Tax=Penicillium antarcticum TaxID=416450 RepID=UPI0023A771A2|nr:uncharacterized protein N7508_010334 [Penicillium antarcticum]KAJ5295513.1 hypothetical protein N7508_010334 [Penicillium antarcticum]